jgi:flagellar FliJ protein
MAFRFPLATLLRLREIAEQREERLLGQIHNQIAQARQTLVDLASRRKALMDQRDQALSRSITGFDLVDSYAQVRAIDGLERSGREHLAKLTVLRDQQMKIYEAAHRDAELLLDIREDRKNDYQKLRDKQEQSAMDDNFSSRRSLN